MTDATKQQIGEGSTRLLNVYHSALQNNPDKTAIVVGEQTCTYRKLDEMVEVYARVLYGMGVKQNSVVGIFMPDCLELIWLFFACNRIGAIANITSAFTQTEELVYEVSSSQASLLVVHSTLYPVAAQLESRIPSLQRILIIDAPPEQPLAWARAVQQAPEQITWPVLSEDQVAVIFYTSGSTAKPKGVTHTHGAFFSAAYNLVISRQHTATDVFAVSFHLSHCAAYRILLSMLYCGGTSVFYDDEKIFKRFAADIFIRSLQQYGATHVMATPSQWKQVLDYPQISQAALPTIRYVSAAGDAVTSELQRQVKEQLGLPLSIVLGMTECGGYILTREAVEPLPGELGIPIYGTLVRLIDEQGQEVALGEVGQIIVKTPAAMIGYWNDPVNTDKVLQNGWVYTGDLARQDESGRYFFVGRCKNTIIRGGGNIAPEEVEDAVSKHPEVKSCGVVGIPDAQYGQAVAAVVVPVDPMVLPAPDSLSEFLQPLLSARKIPEFWYFAAELPLNNVAKLDRKQLAVLVKQLAESEQAL